MTRTSADILTDAPPQAADARLASGPEPLQFGELRLPSGNGRHPIVGLLHGGYWQAIYDLTHAGHLCVDLAAHGVASWNVEYRRVGDPGGGSPGCLNEIVAALEYLRGLFVTYPIDLERVVVAGHSPGGHLALLAAKRMALPLRAVVSLAGVVDLRAKHRSGDDKGIIARLLVGLPDQVPIVWRQASPRAQLPLEIRYVFACGTADVHWKANKETATAARAAGDPVELLPLAVDGHVELIAPRAGEWGITQSKIEQLL